MNQVYTKNKNITIAVAMSGGVDSSVSAALLKEQGYNVLGFFMKNWADTEGLKSSDCPWLQDREDAMRVCAKLDIPFHTLDFEKQYRDQVLDYFFKEYEQGRTPNPDIMCNSKIKFGVFLQEALRLGADMIATGHYARTIYSPSSQRRGLGGGVVDVASKSTSSKPSPHPSPLKGEGVINLLKGIDQNKDQSYFLYRLNQKQLSKAMFPVGELEKTEVRNMAKKFGLPNHDKKDSQGVCFIGHLDLKKFLSQKIKEQPGNIVTCDHKKIGKHDGLFWYTIGQRKGINIGGTGPYYVIKKDFDKNELIVTDDSKDKHLYSSSMEIGDVNWITPSNSPLAEGEVQCRIRYREPLTKCEITKQDDGYRVKFDKPQFAVSAGQSVVFYDKDVCLGGGIINGSMGLSH